MASISCACGQCKLSLSENRPMMSLYCACKDCTQAIKWGEINGGRPPQRLPQAVYIRSDIIAVEGESYMKAVELRRPARSTMVYCTKCYSILGVIHPSYSNNVFMFFPNHCDAALDLSIKPCAVIHTSSYRYNDEREIPSGIPLFKNWDDPREREKFLNIPDVKRSFREPLNSPVGRTLEDVIASIGEIEVLNLEIGAKPI